MSLQLSSWRTVPFQRLHKPGLFFCAALFQRFLQDLVFKRLTTRLAFQLALVHDMNAACVTELHPATIEQVATN